MALIANFLALFVGCALGIFLATVLVVKLGWLPGVKLPFLLERAASTPGVYRLGAWQAAATAAAAVTITVAEVQFQAYESISAKESGGGTRYATESISIGSDLAVEG